MLIVIIPFIATMLDEIEPLIARLNQLLPYSRKKCSMGLVRRRCDTAIMTRHRLSGVCVMIVKESRIKTKSDADGLSRYVLNGAKNEAIRLLTGSKSLMREGLKYGFRHIAFNPAIA